MKNKEADTILKLAQAYKEKGEADKKGAELENLTAQNEILEIEKDLREQQKEINANTITEGAAISQKAVTELNIAIDNADISRATKEGKIQEFFVNLSNMKTEGALTLAKKDLTGKQKEYVEEQIKYYYFDLMTGRISAAAAEKQAENTAQRIKNDFEKNFNQEVARIQKENPNLSEEAERILEILSRAESDIGKARVIVAGYMAREKMAMEQANDYGIVKGE